MSTPNDLSANRYNISPEDMWNSVHGVGQNWGIEGYEAPRQYFDVQQIKWEKQRAEIKEKHKPQWPPTDWPKEKGSDKLVPPKRINFIDETIKLANSFCDPNKSKELHDQLAPKGIFDPPKQKQIVDQREKFLEEKKKAEERRAAQPKVYEWRVSAIEAAENKAKEDEKNKKTQTQKNLERYTKDKPQWPRCDKVTIMADCEYVGERIPFYNSFAKEGEKVEKLFFPMKEKFMRRAPAWAFENKNRLKGPTDQMKAREQSILEKASNYMSSKNLKESDLFIDVERSQKLMDKRGRYPITIAKSWDYTTEDHYKNAREQHPSYSPGPNQYWQMPIKTEDTNTKPPAPGTATLNGKDIKVYYLNRRRTDHVISKPMRKSVF